MNTSSDNPEAPIARRARQSQSRTCNERDDENDQDHCCAEGSRGRRYREMIESQESRIREQAGTSAARRLLERRDAPSYWLLGYLDAERAAIGHHVHGLFRIAMISVWIGCPVTSISLSET